MSNTFTIVAARHVLICPEAHTPYISVWPYNASQKCIVMARPGMNALRTPFSILPLCSLETTFAINKQPPAKLLWFVSFTEEKEERSSNTDLFTSVRPILF